jgi:NADPH:quinone reductase-like Zn-dependent oxidoreductase
MDLPAANDPRQRNHAMTKRLRNPLSGPATMGAIRPHRPGDPAALAYEQVQTPRPGPGEVLVRVHAAAITRDELDWAADRLPATPSYEFSGIVAEVGQGVADITPGAAGGVGGLAVQLAHARGPTSLAPARPAMCTPHASSGPMR